MGRKHERPVSEASVGLETQRVLTGDAPTSAPRLQTPGEDVGVAAALPPPKDKPCLLYAAISPRHRYSL